MRDNFAEINVVPLVDVMLVLLVIVLVTANFMVRGVIDVNLPKSEAQQNATQEVLLVEMRLDGSLYYEGRKVNPDKLPEFISKEDRKRPVLIRADKDLTLQPFISMIDQLKKSGFTKISVQTEK